MEMALKGLSSFFEAIYILAELWPICCTYLSSVCYVGERSSTGRLEWDTRNEAIDALVLANHTHLPNPSM